MLVRIMEEKVQNSLNAKVAATKISNLQRNPAYSRLTEKT